MNVWRRYLDSINEKREVENIPSDELNVLMCRFFMSVKKKDGSHYEPVSLTSFHRSLQRFLNDKGSPLKSKPAKRPTVQKVQRSIVCQKKTVGR